MNKKQLAILIILSICIFLSSLMMQLSISAESTILNADFYSSFVQKHNLCNIPQNFVLLTIKNNTRELDEKTYQSLVKATSNTFSQEWTREQVSGLINNLLAYLKNSSDELDLRIDFRTQKSQLISQMLPVLPEATEDDIINKVLLVHIAENLSDSAGIPDYLDLRYTSLITDSGVLTYIDAARTYYPYSKYLPFLLFSLFFISMLFLFKISDCLKNTGYALAISGLVVIVFVSYISGVLDSSITAQLSSYDELLAITGNNPKILASIFKNSILNVTNRIAIAFCLTGIFLFIVGIFTAKIRRKSRRISQQS
ncbi:hypothetical protein ASZ90_018796 [hydrocarbon metagenome]|uniref:Uncharacterized protein n=1 Tax=hydrocarbon metagenome TaxID=938273 RepID=A0A0W8E5T5_9ZZZZ